jgi:hypothetical protein
MQSGARYICHLITDDGTPMTAIKGDCRREMAQRLGALLESNAIEMKTK